MYYTYVLFSHKDKSLYTGSTNNLKRRIIDHERGAVSSTKLRLPVELIYYEACTVESDCRKREKYLKSGPGKKYLKHRLRQYFLGIIDR